MNSIVQLPTLITPCLIYLKRGVAFARVSAFGLAITLMTAGGPWAAAWAKPDPQDTGRPQMGAKARSQREGFDRAQVQSQNKAHAQAQMQSQNQAQIQAQAEARAQSKATENQAVREQRQPREQLRDQVREQQESRRRDATLQPTAPLPQESRAGQRLSQEERQVLREQLRAARKIQLP